MPPYVGRFAPTPSGALHLGSLVAALGSWLDARAARGRWMLRIDDLDRPRVMPGAEDEILRQLESHGLWWDGPIRRQSEHVPEYLAALDRLRREAILYACRCTRAELARLSLAGEVPDEGEVAYPGTCRDAQWPEIDAALRVRIDGADIADVGGDFVVRRRDGQIGYQVACAIDEHALGITDVVRGADLVQSGCRQRWILRKLGLTVPRYRHLPLVLTSSGRKLSKSTQAAALHPDRASTNLRLALLMLGQDVPGEDLAPDIPYLLNLAASRWAPDRVGLEPVRVT